MCDALRDLVPFVQWKKREKKPKNTENCYLWLDEASNFTKSSTPPRLFFTFFKL